VEPLQDIPDGRAAIYAKDSVEWGEECDTWRIRFAGS